MAYYRLYFLDHRGHIETYESFEADMDGDAIAKADRRKTLLGKELWCGGKRLAQWSPGGAVAQNPVVGMRPIGRQIG